MTEYKKSARRDPEGRVIYLSAGCDYVRRKDPGGKFRFRKAAKAHGKAPAKAPGKAQGKAARGSKRRVGGAMRLHFNKHIQQTLSEMMPLSPGSVAGPEERDILAQIINETSADGGSEDTERVEAFMELLDIIEADAASGSPVLPAFDSFQVIMHHKLPDSDEDGRQAEMTEEEERFRELRLLFYPDGRDLDVYFHFSRPKAINDPEGFYKWRANSHDGKENFAVPVDSSEIVVVEAEDDGYGDGIGAGNKAMDAATRFLASRKRFAPVAEPATTYPPGLGYPPGLAPPLPAPSRARKAAARKPAAAPGARAAPKAPVAPKAATRATRTNIKAPGAASGTRAKPSSAASGTRAARPQKPSSTGTRAARPQKPSSTGTRAARPQKPSRAASGSKAKPSRAASASRPASASKAAGTSRPASASKMNPNASAFLPANSQPQPPRALNPKASAFLPPVPGYPVVPPPPPPQRPQGPTRPTLAALNPDASIFKPAA